MHDQATLMIEVQDVTKTFHVDGRRVDALGHVSLAVRQNQFISIVGPSGCGKSTLLRMAAGFLHPTTGRVFVQGKAVNGIAADHGIGYVAQEDALFPWLTAAENIEFPLRVRGWNRVRRAERVRELLEMVGLADAGGKFIYQLSGGMKKRVAIAQALSYEPEVLLMDEPFGPLDSQTRMILQQELLDLLSGTGKAVLFITHDLVEAIALSDVVVVMTKPPGLIKRILDVTIPRPRNIFEMHARKDFQEMYEALWPLLHDELV